MDNIKEEVVYSRLQVSRHLPKAEVRMNHLFEQQPLYELEKQLQISKLKVSLA